MMQHEEWYIEGCVKASPEEWALYREWTGHLPVREESTPYHSGPHSIKNFRHALAIAGFSHDFSFSVIEVGFCLGHSSEIFLREGAAHVTSVEISDRAQTIAAKESMEKKWGGKFQFLSPDQASYYSAVFDFGFIDGDHSAEAIRNDIDLMRQYQVGWILFDDFWPHWGDTQIVMKEQGICPVAILGTMALCKFP
jgi:hypothetical protein